MSARGAIHRVRSWAATTWPLLQGTLAATAAWVIAKRLGDHDNPFFAPIAAVVALTAARGERGRNAVRLLAGVFVGIVAGEITVAVLGGGTWSLAVALFVAVTVAQALRGARLMLNQAAAAAILTVAVADGQAGVDRLLDALIGAGVALIFTQVLFSPEPVALVRRAEATALTGLAEGLGLTAEALERENDDLADRATSRLRAVRDEMAELARVRRASTRIVRHSLIWRGRMAPVMHENENAGHLDLLGTSCLQLARTTTVAGGVDRELLASSVRDLAGALADLAADPGGITTRQGAVDRALDVARRLASGAEATGTPAALLSARMVVADIMVFAGADASEAKTAAEAGTGELRATAPPHRVSLRSTPSGARGGPRRQRRLRGGP
jgi:uncharacterized membrane protein YgaE (UPF0421/DUF939 family)